MTKNFDEKLKTSLDAEKKTSQDKFKKTFDKFDKAEQVLGDNPTQEQLSEIVQRLSKTEQQLEEQKKKKSKKVKFIRLTFSAYPDIYDLLNECQSRSAKAGQISNYSELIRGGLKALLVIPEKELTEILKSVKIIRRGKKEE